MVSPLSDAYAHNTIQNIWYIREKMCLACISLILEIGEHSDPNGTSVSSINEEKKLCDMLQAFSAFFVRLLSLTETSQSD